MKKPLCIHHAFCADGFSSCYAVWKKHGENFEYYPGQHNTSPPDITNRDVYLVDFSYKRPVIEEMIDYANSITILDHHKSAQEDLQDLLDSGELHGVFDLEKSGAMITWEWFHPGVEPPPLMYHIQDRDLYRFDLEGTQEIQMAVFSYEYTFDNWVYLMEQAELEDLIREGVAIERKHNKDIEELVGNCAYWTKLFGYEFPIVNVPYTMGSDAAAKLLKKNPGAPFAGYYLDTKGGRYFGLRSEDNRVDVSAVAARFGGGGHRNAAGFKIKFEDKNAVFEVSQNDSE